jgi:YHS domain-containing protein
MVLLVANTVAGAGSVEAQAQRPNVDSTGTGLAGYDPVAYFTLGRPEPGLASITTNYDGIVYQFASDEHRRRFLSDPDRYLPAYGGWCAYAMASGSYAAIDPEAWIIHDGTLYLNFSARINRRFQRDLNGYISAADDHWRSLEQNQ